MTDNRLPHRSSSPLPFREHRLIFDGKEQPNKLSTESKEVKESIIKALQEIKDPTDSKVLQQTVEKCLRDEESPLNIAGLEVQQLAQQIKGVLSEMDHKIKLPAELLTHKEMLDIALKADLISGDTLTGIGAEVEKRGRREVGGKVEAGARKTAQRPKAGEEAVASREAGEGATDAVGMAEEIHELCDQSRTLSYQRGNGRIQRGSSEWEKSVEQSRTLAKEIKRREQEYQKLFGKPFQRVLREQEQERRDRLQPIVDSDGRKIGVKDPETGVYIRGQNKAERDAERTRELAERAERRMLYTQPHPRDASIQHMARGMYARADALRGDFGPAQELSRERGAKQHQERMKEAKAFLAKLQSEGLSLSDLPAEEREKIEKRYRELGVNLDSAATWEPEKPPARPPTYTYIDRTGKDGLTGPVEGYHNTVDALKQEAKSGKNRDVPKYYKNQPRGGRFTPWKTAEEAEQYMREQEELRSKYTDRMIGNYPEMRAKFDALGERYRDHPQFGHKYRQFDAIMARAEGDPYARLTEFRTQIEAYSKGAQVEGVMERNRERILKEGCLERSVLDILGMSEMVQAADWRTLTISVRKDGKNIIYHPGIVERFDDAQSLENMHDLGVDFENKYLLLTGYRTGEEGKKKLKDILIRFSQPGTYDVTYSVQGFQRSKTITVQKDAMMTASAEAVSKHMEKPGQKEREAAMTAQLAKAKERHEKVPETMRSAWYVTDTDTEGRFCQIDVSASPDIRTKDTVYAWAYRPGKGDKIQPIGEGKVASVGGGYAVIRFENPVWLELGDQAGPKLPEGGKPPPAAPAKGPAAAPSTGPSVPSTPTAAPITTPPSAPAAPSAKLAAPEPEKKPDESDQEKALKDLVERIIAQLPENAEPKNIASAINNALKTEIIDKNLATAVDIQQALTGSPCEIGGKTYRFEWKNGELNLVPKEPAKPVPLSLPPDISTPPALTPSLVKDPPEKVPKEIKDLLKELIASYGSLEGTTYARLTENIAAGKKLLKELTPSNYMEFGGNVIRLYDEILSAAAMEKSNEIFKEETLKKLDAHLPELAGTVRERFSWLENVEIFFEKARKGMQDALAEAEAALKATKAPEPAKPADTEKTKDVSDTEKIAFLSDPNSTSSEKQQVALDYIGDLVKKEYNKEVMQIIRDHLEELKKYPTLIKDPGRTMQLAGEYLKYVGKESGVAERILRILVEDLETALQKVEEERRKKNQPEPEKKTEPAKLSASSSPRSTPSVAPSLPRLPQGDAEVVNHLLSERADLKDIAKYADNRNVILGVVSRRGRGLEFASNRLKDDREVVAAAVRNDTDALQYASPELRDDADIVRIGIVNRIYETSLKHASDRLRNDKSLVLKAVRENGEDVQYASEALRNDKEIMNAAINESPFALQFASEQLKADKAYIKEVVRKQGYVLRYAADNVKDDREGVAAAVNNNAGALEFASPRLKDDKSIVLSAVSKYWGMIAYASERLQNDDDVIARIAPHIKDGYIPEELRNIRRVVLIGLEQSPYALRYASERLRDDRELVLFALSKIRSSDDVDAHPLRYASKRLQGDKDVVLTAIRTEPSSLQYASESLRDNEEIVLEVVRVDRTGRGKANLVVQQPGYAFTYASERLRSDRNFVLKVVRINPHASVGAIPALQNDPEILKIRGTDPPAWYR